MSPVAEIPEDPLSNIAPGRGILTPSVKVAVGWHACTTDDPALRGIFEDDDSVTTRESSANGGELVPQLQRTGNTFTAEQIGPCIMKRLRD